MTVSTIGPVAHLAAHLRQHLAGLSATSPVSARTAPQPTANLSTKRRLAESPRDKARSHANEDLASALARRLSVIDRADPDRKRKAFRVFLESVLLDEWGASLINDPGFQQLVDSVQAQMETRADLRALMDDAAGRLLAEQLAE